MTSTQNKKEDKEHGKPPKTFEDVELQALLDEDVPQTQKQLAEQLGVSQKAASNRPGEMKKIQKTGRWVPHKLNDRQMEKRNNIRHFDRSVHYTLQHRTWDEEWIYIENPKSKKSRIDPGAPSISTTRPNRIDRKTMLCV